MLYNFYIMKLPVIITNSKNYHTSYGEKGRKIVELHKKIVQELGVSMAVAVPITDLQDMANLVDIPIFAQHVDAVTHGSSTGHILPEAVKEAGAFGTLLNHSEHRLSMDVLEKSIKRAKEVGLFVVACCESPEEGAEIVKFGPDLVAFEPRELIGGDISVSTAKPEVIKQAVQLIGEGKVLVGAGVKNSEDVRIALHLGAVGVLLASGVMKAEDPEAVLRDLGGGMKDQ